MIDLSTILDRHVAALTAAILDSIKQLSINDIMGEGDTEAPAPPAGKRRAAGAAPRARKARSPRAPMTASANPRSEVETSVLEHLNEAGPKGSNLKAWIISTHGELEPEAHARFEREGLAAFRALEERGAITSRFGGPARGTVYALAPAS